MLDKIAFIAGRSVAGEDFFGRKTLLNIISNRLQTQKSTIIVGTRRIGKSSILRELERTIKLETMPWLILSGTERSSDEFLRSIARDINGEAKKLPKEINNISKQVSETLHYPSFPKDMSVVEKLIHETCELLEENKMPIVLLIDEIDDLLFRLTSDDASQRVAFLRQFASFGRPPMVCTSFVSPASIQFWEHGSSWHNVFATETVGLFFDEEALEMLTVLSEKSGNKFSENECRFVMEVFGNFPFYLQKFGYELFAREEFQSLKGRERKEAFTDVIPTVVYELQDIHFGNLIKHLDGEEFSLMTKVSHNKTITEKEEKTYWKLKQLGLLVGTIQDPQIPSLILAEFMRSLPQKSMWDKAGKSPAWEKIRTFAYGVLNAAIVSAVETATKKYL